MIIILTSREELNAKETEAFLHRHGVRFDSIVYKVPFGERVLINDRKPSGLNTALAINVERDKGCQFGYLVDNNL